MFNTHDFPIWRVFSALQLTRLAAKYIVLAAFECSSPLGQALGDGTNAESGNGINFDSGDHSHDQLLHGVDFDPSALFHVKGPNIGYPAFEKS